jgi:cell division ATPase FtsA
MPQIAELAGEVFEMSCVVGKPRDVAGLATATEGPEYATCSGLIQYACKQWQNRRRTGPLGGLLKSFLKH